MWSRIYDFIERHIIKSFVVWSIAMILLGAFLGHFGG